MRQLVVPVLALIWSACGPAALASSTFEGDNEGWSLSNNGPLIAPTLAREGGNPAGNLCGRDEIDGDIWYFVAPPKYLGNMSGAMGKRLTFDLRQGNMFNQIRGRDVVLNGGGLAVTWEFRSPPRLDWTPFSVRFDGTSGWLIDEPNGAAATEDDLRTVLSDVRSLRVRGEFFDGVSANDTACIDNIYLGRD